jgi:hypothetical protein
MTNQMSLARLTLQNLESNYPHANRPSATDLIDQCKHDSDLPQERIIDPSTLNLRSQEQFKRAAEARLEAKTHWRKPTHHLEGNVSNGKFESCATMVVQGKQSKLAKAHARGMSVVNNNTIDNYINRQGDFRFPTGSAVGMRLNAYTRP